MSQPLLHHYPASVYAEKVRLALGAKSLEWGAVEVGPIMPRPFLMPMTGGYRRIPVLQIGANVYCDSRVILDQLDRLEPTPPMRPAGQAAAVEALETLADLIVFRAFVTLCFQPAAVAETMKAMDATAIEAFQKDRAELGAGASGLAPMTVPAAKAALAQVLGEFERTLEGQDWLAADQVTAADLAIYHPLWAMAGNPVVAPELAPWPNVGAWMQRVAGLGHGSPTPVAGETALEACREATPVAPAGLAPHCDGLAAGTAVDVAATDYGVHPVSGTLVGSSAREVVIRRFDEQAGEVMVHFPRAGFQVTERSS